MKIASNHTTTTVELWNPCILFKRRILEFTFEPYFFMKFYYLIYCTPYYLILSFHISLFTGFASQGGAKLCTDDSPQCLCQRVCYPKLPTTMNPCSCGGDDKKKQGGDSVVAAAVPLVAGVFAANQSSPSAPVAVVRADNAAPTVSVGLFSHFLSYILIFFWIDLVSDFFGHSNFQRVVHCLKMKNKSKYYFQRHLDTNGNLYLK